MHLAGQPDAGSAVWGLAVVLLSAELLAEAMWTVAVEHHMGVDVIALVAMVGALVLGQELGGLIRVYAELSPQDKLDVVRSMRARAELRSLRDGPEHRGDAGRGAGYLPPVAGAMLQEGIDLAVILNALRALRG